MCVCVCVQYEGAPAEGVIDSLGTGPDVTPLPCHPWLCPASVTCECTVERVELRQKKKMVQREDPSNSDLLQIQQREPPFSVFNT